MASGCLEPQLLAFAACSCSIPATVDSVCLMVASCWHLAALSCISCNVPATVDSVCLMVASCWHLAAWSCISCNVPATVDCVCLMVASCWHLAAQCCSIPATVLMLVSLTQLKDRISSVLIKKKDFWVLMHAIHLFHSSMHVVDGYTRNIYL